MRLLPLTGLIVALATGAAAAETRNIAVRGLRALDVSGPINVVVTRGAAAATLEGDPSDMARLGVTATADGLRVWRKCTVFCSNREFDVTLRVASPDLASLTISKGVDATVSDSVAPQLALDLSMGAALDIAGVCDTLRARAAMGAELDAGGLVCRDVSIDAAMGADASVHATASATAKASMGASVSIAGRPSRVDSDAGMGGSIDAD